MKNFRLKMVLNMLVGAIVVSVLFGYAFKFLLPSYFSEWFWGILLFFCISEAGIVYLVDALTLKVTENKMRANLYLAVLVIKMVLALIIIILYSSLIDIETPAFAATFVFLYLIFLGFQTRAFTKIEANLKEKRN